MRRYQKHPHSILLIDPFKNLVNAYHIFLAEEGYSVEVALNLGDAYRLVNKNRYDIMIMEYVSPFVDTEEMIDRVKKFFPDTYILMVTNATIDEETYERLFTLGVDDFILKPYSPDKILVHLRKGLKQRELILQLQELKRLNLLDRITEEINAPVFNRVFFEKWLRQELKKSKRHQHPFSLLLIRTGVEEREKLGDGFDRFYSELIRMIRRSSREEDVVCKNNGEISLILPETDEKGCEALMRRLSNIVQTHTPFKSDKVLKPFVQTLSFQSYTYPTQFEIPESLKRMIT
jgi:PleD family two-component response regulator